MAFAAVGSALKAVAKASVDVTKSVYNDLSSFPTEMTCSNPECGKALAIPPQVWAWTCSSGHPNDGSASTCLVCAVARPAIQPPSIACALCGTVSVVPISNARKYANNTGKAVVQGGTAVRDFTVSTYKDLTARPKTVVCSSAECKVAVLIPEGTWVWYCTKGHANDGGNTCTQCTEAAPQRQLTVRCTACGASSSVPSSVAGQYMSQAVGVTKRAATTVKEGATKMAAAPDTFNCATCNTQLHTPAPAPWKCETEGCARINAPDTQTCATCNKTQPRKVVCGKCGSLTDIPSSNFSNSVRSTKNSVAQGYQSAKGAVNFVGENKETIQAGADFARENPELVKGAAKAMK